MRLHRALPRREDARVIGRQLLRSGTSVGANDRAARRGRSRAEFVAKLGIVLEEADETVFWLELLQESEICQRGEVGAPCPRGARIDRHLRSIDLHYERYCIVDSPRSVLRFEPKSLGFNGRASP